MAMLNKGEVDVAALLTAPLAEEVKRDPTLRSAFSGGIGISSLECIEQWDPKSPWYAKRVRLAVNYAIDRWALSKAETPGASIPTGSIIPQHFEFVLPIDPYPYAPPKARQWLAEADTPTGEGG
jgi:ABC-type transport system substrate-binding protein